MADDLRQARFENIFVSELLRTQQTADAVNKYHHKPVTVDARLNDNRNGFEGKIAEDYYAMLDTTPNKWEARLNDGESIADVKKRVVAFISDLQQKEYQAVLVVTSKVIIQLFYGVIDNLSYEELWKLKIERGSCIEVEI